MENSIFCAVSVGHAILQVNEITKALTHFKAMFHFYTVWKRQKSLGFLTFLGGIKMEYWFEMG